MPGRWSGAQERTSGSEGAQKRVYFQDKKKIETKFKILFLVCYIFPICFSKKIYNFKFDRKNYIPLISGIIELIFKNLLKWPGLKHRNK